MKIKFDGIIEMQTMSRADKDEMYDTQKGLMQRTETIDLMEAIAAKTQKMIESEGCAENFKSWNMVDKIAWYVSEAWCVAFVAGAEVATKAFCEALKAEGGIEV